MTRYYLLMVSGSDIDPCNQYAKEFFADGTIALTRDRSSAYHFATHDSVCFAIFRNGVAWRNYPSDRIPSRRFKIVRVTEEVSVTETVVD